MPWRSELGGQKCRGSALSARRRAEEVPEQMGFQNAVLGVLGLRL